jgi:hypothetical protein
MAWEQEFQNMMQGREAIIPYQITYVKPWWKGKLLDAWKQNYKFSLVHTEETSDCFSHTLLEL